MENVRRYRAYYEKVSVSSKITTCILCVLICCVIIAIKIYDVLPWLFWLCVFLLLLFIALMIIIGKIQSKKLFVLKEEAFGIHGEYERTGLFKEIWDEYEYNQFEGMFEFSHYYKNKNKITYIDDYNNIIHIVLKRKRHEFDIQFYESGIVITAGEGGNCSKQKVIGYDDLPDVGEAFYQIRQYILEYSNKS
jgi:hypothetical protein